MHICSTKHTTCRQHGHLFILCWHHRYGSLWQPSTLPIAVLCILIAWQFRLYCSLYAVSTLIFQTYVDEMEFLTI